MGIVQAHNAIIARIQQQLAPANVVTPDSGHLNLPRYVCQPAGGTQLPLGVGGLTEAFPEVVVMVETSSAASVSVNNTMVSALVDLFKPGLIFSGVTVDQRPQVRPPLEDGATYRVPVVIRVRIIF